MSAKLPARTWPRDFVWGVSTSAFQVEGAAREDGRGPSIWDTRCTLPGKVQMGGTGDVACDHYHRYREDVAIMESLGIDAYRFSIAWPRVLPAGRGKVNEAGMAFYDRLVDALLAAGIEPWACLYHWDLPQALENLGGWTSRDSAGWFADYAALMARRLGDRVKRWITFNEFSVFTLFGYAMDWCAPGLVDRTANLRAIHHVNLAHGRGVDVLRDTVRDASIGAIHNRQAVRPATPSEADRQAAEMLDVHWNLAFPEPQLRATYPARLIDAIEPWVEAGDMAQICRRIDWLGVNHYGPIFAKADPNAIWGFAWADPPADAVVREDIGWAIFPDAFRDELIELSRRYGLPVYVTENGCGSVDTPDASGEVHDPRRIAYLETYTAAMHDAIRAGADVRGYFVWSLLDSFEWGAGYTNPFGLVHVDFATLKRTPKASARWYANFIEQARNGRTGAGPQTVDNAASRLPGDSRRPPAAPRGQP
ncbi:MAG: GH1 family beta-glucosidase [Burkholderiaceae bacterium]